MNSSDENVLMVFTKPGHCVQCERVKGKFDDAGLTYTEALLHEEDGSQSELAAEYTALAKERGMSSAPVVVRVQGGKAVDLFAGYNPVKVKDFIECFTSNSASD